jgi:hypothetical protein
MRFSVSRQIFIGKTVKIHPPTIYTLATPLPAPAYVTPPAQAPLAGAAASVVGIPVVRAATASLQTVFRLVAPQQTESRPASRQSASGHTLGRVMLLAWLFVFGSIFGDASIRSLSNEQIRTTALDSRNTNASRAEKPDAAVFFVRVSAVLSAARDIGKASFSTFAFVYSCPPVLASCSPRAPPFPVFA